MAKKIRTENVGTAAASVNTDKWWKCSESDAFKNLFATVRFIESNQSYKSSENLRFARMYSNKAVRGLSVGTYALTEASSDRLALNVVKSNIDTAASKIAKNKPKPLFLTQNGDFTLKQRAQLLTQYMEGMFEEMDMYVKGQKVFIDGATFGTGALKLYIDPSDYKIKAERVLIQEIIVDDVEGMYGEPRQIHQKKYIPREVLQEMFPDHKDIIREAKSDVVPSKASMSSADNVMVLESWHLPSGPNAKDGKHIIAIDSGTLVLDDYKKDYFPFIFFRWTDKLVGFWGMGIAEELIGIQIEINDIVRSIQKGIKLLGVPRIYLETGSKVVPAHLNNDIGSIVNYTGTKPTQEAAPVMPGEMYSWLENLFQKSFEITGISRLSAQAQKPAGLNSGAALREFQDIESERFMLVGERYEKFFMEAARQIIDLSKELQDIIKAKKVEAKDSKDRVEIKELAVLAKDNKFVQKIKWKDVDMDEDQYQMQIFPVNLLPSTPAGKLATIQEMLQAGMIQQDQAMSLLDFPDLDKYQSLATADQDNTERMLGIMTSEGRYIPPEPFMNLQLAQQLTQQHYLRAKCDNLDEDKLQLLRDFMDDIQTLLNPPAPPADPMLPPAAPPPGGPVANGGAPPPAELAPMSGNPLPPSGLPQ